MTKYFRIGKKRKNKILKVIEFYLKKNYLKKKNIILF